MRISLDSVKQLLGHAAFLRAQKYATGSRVKDLRFEPLHDTLRSVVSGTQNAAYAVHVQLASRGEEYRVVRSSCSCSVGMHCKHVGATLIIFGQRLAAEPRPVSSTTWRQDLMVGAGSSRSNLMRTSLDTSDSALPQLGLLLQPYVSAQMPMPRWHSSRSDKPVLLRIKPTAQTSSGSWPRNGVQWHDIERGELKRQWPEAQIQVINSLGAMFRETQYGTQDWLDITGKNTQNLWDTLMTMKDLGVSLWIHPEIKTPVRMHATAARLAMQLDRDERFISLRPRVSVSDLVFDGHNTILIGRPANVILAWQADSNGVLSYHLAQLYPAADESIVKLVNRRDPVQMNVSVLDDFQSRILPALRQKIDVVSTDLEFQVEDPKTPLLQIELWHQGTAELKVALRWVYFYNVSEGVTEEVIVPFDARIPTWFERDLDLEASIAERVEAYLRTAGIVTDEHDMAHLALGTTDFSGREALDFAAQHAIALGDLPDVRVQQVNNDRVYRAAASTPEVSLTTSQSGQRDWFDLHVTITIDGEEVPLAELITVMTQQQGVMILASGTYFDTDVPELHQLRDLVNEARAMQDGGSQELRVSRYQFSLLEDLAALEMVNAQSEAWQHVVARLNGAEIDHDLQVPDSIQATLRPYQVDGFRWLAFLQEQGLGGVLADDMGLGKTLQIISMIAHAKSENPFLVVCPTSVIGNWVAECKKFAPHLRVTSVDETSRRRAASLRRDHHEFDVIITSYTIFRLDYDEFGDLPWTGAIFDEAQFLKNARTKVYECAKLVPAEFKIAATGTPMENRLAELWALFSVVSPGLYPQRRLFEDTVAKPIERDGSQETLNQLRRRIKPFMLRRTKEEVVKDLPPKQEQVIELELEPTHRRIYDTLLNRERQKILGLIEDMPRNQIQIFRALTTLRQAALDVSLVDPMHAGVPSTKLDFLVETLEEIIAEKHRVIVFSQFTGFLTKVRQMLDREGIRYTYLDGATRKRAEVIDSFKEGDAPVFLISLKAGGFGLNLTEADYCILLDPWWNPAAEEQAVDRVHRIGQTKNVMVYRLVATNTIEEKVMALKAQKSALFDSVLEGGFAQAATLTADEIRELLA